MLIIAILPLACAQLSFQRMVCCRLTRSLSKALHPTDRLEIYLATYGGLGEYVGYFFGVGMRGEGWFTLMTLYSSREEGDAGADFHSLSLGP